MYWTCCHHTHALFQKANLEPDIEDWRRDLSRCEATNIGGSFGNTRCSDVGIDDNDIIYVAGGGISTNSKSIAAYDREGHRLWYRRITTQFYNHLLVHPSEDVLVASDNAGRLHWFHKDGELFLTQGFQGPNGAWGASHLCTDGEFIYGVEGFRHKKWSLDGTQHWNIPNIGFSGTTSAHWIEDVGGTLYASATAFGGGIYIGRINKSDGAVEEILGNNMLPGGFFGTIPRANALLGMYSEQEAIALGFATSSLTAQLGSYDTALGAGANWICNLPGIPAQVHFPNGAYLDTDSIWIVIGANTTGQGGMFTDNLFQISRANGSIMGQWNLLYGWGFENQFGQQTVRLICIDVKEDYLAIGYARV